MNGAEKKLDNAGGRVSDIGVMSKATKLQAIVSKAFNDKFYGELTIKFEAGIPVHISKKESMKL